MEPNVLPGIYGKLPDRGDFVTLRLPRRFVAAWDGWLQSAVACSQEQLGEAWLERYLVSPPWRFLLSEGACGPQSWAGVIIPSVDRVGRYFPLTLAMTLSDAGFALLADDDGWFDAAEEALLYTLSDDFSMETFESALTGLPQASLQKGAAGAQAATLPRAWRIMRGSDDRPADVLAQLCRRLLDTRYSAYSIWWNASVRFNAGLLVTEGLPRVQAYASLLDGNWERGSWQLLGADAADASSVLEQPDAGLASDARRVAQTAPLGEAPVRHPATGPGGSASSAQPTLMDILNEKPRTSAVPPHSSPTAAASAAAAPVPQGAGKPVRPGAGPMPPDVPDNVPDNGPMPHGIGANDHGFSSAAVSHAGYVRARNEDAVLARPELGLWVVADGMGGHRDGAAASKSVVSALDDLLPGDKLDDLLEAVAYRLQRVDRELRDLGAGADIVGSTVVALVAIGDQGACLWAGDSRLYRLRRGELAQLSRDHSQTRSLVAQGRLNADQARHHPEANVITRAVGRGDLKLDSLRFSLAPGDVFMLCSDGLNREVDDREIASVLTDADTLEIGVQELLRRGLDYGGRDNISLITVRVP